MFSSTHGVFRFSLVSGPMRYSFLGKNNTCQSSLFGWWGLAEDNNFQERCIEIRSGIQKDGPRHAMFLLFSLDTTTRQKSIWLSESDWLSEHACLNTLTTYWFSEIVSISAASLQTCTVTPASKEVNELLKTWLKENEPQQGICSAQINVSQKKTGTQDCLWSSFFEWNVLIWNCLVAFLCPFLFTTKTALFYCKGLSGLDGPPSSDQTANEKCTWLLPRDKGGVGTFQCVLAIWWQPCLCQQQRQHKETPCFSAEIDVPKTTWFVSFSLCHSYPLLET